MKTTTVACDQCGTDLTETDNCSGYRIALSNEPIPSKGGVVTLRLDQPLLKKDVHLCGVRCLKAFVGAL